jgi:hypothetical protein
MKLDKNKCPFLKRGNQRGEKGNFLTIIEF